MHGDPVMVFRDHDCVQVIITGATSADIAPAKIGELTCIMAAARAAALAWPEEQARDFATRDGTFAGPADGTGEMALERLGQAAYERHMGKRTREIPWSALTPAGRQAWARVALAVLAAAGEHPAFLDAIPAVHHLRQDLAEARAAVPATEADR